MMILMSIVCKSLIEGKSPLFTAVHPSFLVILTPYKSYIQLTSFYINVTSDSRLDALAWFDGFKLSLLQLDSRKIKMPIKMPI